eukprot:4516034-Amphidinium_carterae.3
MKRVLDEFKAKSTRWPGIMFVLHALPKFSAPPSGPSEVHGPLTVNINAELQADDNLSILLELKADDHFS